MAATMKDPVQSKLTDLLESIRREFQQVSQEADSYRLRNQKDYDFKINQQLAEMQQIRNTVYELELTHRKMKDLYEEKIKRLKVELEQKDRQIASLTVYHQQQQQLAAANAAAAVTSPGYTNEMQQQQQRAQQPQIAQTQVALTNNALPPVAQTYPSIQQSTAQADQPKLPKVQSGESLPQSADNIKDSGDASKSKKLESVHPTDTTKENHYLVPYEQRAAHTRPIPPFLLDLDTQNVPAHLKKQTDDYYILYNPAIPKRVDVEMHKSLDHTSVVCCVRFNNNGEFLATGCNKTTQIYRVSDGELVARLSDDNPSQHIQNNSQSGENDTNQKANTISSSSDLYVRSVCFSPDGKFLATGAEDRLIRIWDIEQKKIVMVLQGHEQDIYSLDYFPSGDKLVSGSGDRTVRIWDLKTGKCSLTLSIEDGVTTVAVSPGDGKYIAAGSLDRAVRVWDSETGFLVERLDSENELGTGHKDSVYSVVFTKDGGAVVSGSLDRTVKLWNLRGSSGSGSELKPNSQGVCEVTYMGHKDFVLSVATAENDEMILSGSKDRGVLLWDTKSGNPLLMLQGHKNSVISVASTTGRPLGEDFGVFATGSGDCKARIWKYTKPMENAKQ